MGIYSHQGTEIIFLRVLRRGTRHFCEMLMNPALHHPHYARIRVAVCYI